MPTFEVHVPVGANQIWHAPADSRSRCRSDAAAASCARTPVDSITGENSGDNLGPGTPIIHFDQWERPDIEVKLILKGGGCENTNAQYRCRWSSRISDEPTARSTASGNASCTQCGPRKARAAAPAPSASASAAIARPGYIAREGTAASGRSTT